MSYNLKTAIYNQLARYHAIPLGAKAAFWFAVCSVIQKGIQFVTVPLFTRMLTTEQFGQYNLYQSWLGIISIFATLNLAAGVFNNGMIKYYDRRSQYITSMQGLSTISTSIVFALYLVAPGWWQKALGLPNIVILAMFLELLFTPAMNYWSMRQRFEYRYKALMVQTLSVAAINPIIGLIAVENSTEKGIARILSVALLNAIVGAFFYIYNAALGRSFFDKQQWGFALAFNLPLIPHYLSQLVLSQSDRIMIEKMFSTSEVAIYSLAYSIGMIMNIITTSVNSSFVPWTYQACQNKEYGKLKEVSNGLVLMIACIALLPALFAPEIIAIMGPADYGKAAYLIPPISVAAYFIFVYSLFGNIEFFFEESKFVMFASCVAAAVNLVLNYIFMRIFGYMAAAYTTLVCYIILAIAHYFFMKLSCRKHNIEGSFYDVFNIVGVSIILIIVALGLMVLYPYPIIRCMLLGGGGIIVLTKRKWFINKYQTIKRK